MIHIRTLGPVDVRLDDDPAPRDLQNWRKNLALLIYLARSPRRARTRDHLVGLLWPEKTEDKARHSLDVALAPLRSYLGEGALETKGDQLRLAGDVVDLDVDRLTACLDASDWAGAAALVGGEFLDGFSVAGASDFDTWLGAERLYWRRRSIEALTRRATELSDEGYSPEAADLAHRALQLDPDSAAAVRTAMYVLASGGERAAALELYAEFERKLRALGTAPDPDLKELADRIRREHEWRLPRLRLPEPPRRSPLVAPGKHLASLINAWTACRAGRAGMAVVEGDAGTGKTRLLEELALRARLERGAVLLARAVEADRSAPGAALLALVRGGLLDVPGIAGASPAALAAFVPADPAWATRFPDSAKATPLPAAAAFTALVREAAAEQPLAILLDDAQWADDESLQALAALARDVAQAPVLIVLATTGYPPRDPIDALRTRVGRDVPGVTVRLGPFDHAGLVDLVRWALPRAADDLVDRLARRLAADTGGLPLLAVELAKAIMSGAELPPADNTWLRSGHTLDQTLPGDLPDAVIASIRGNYNRSNSGTQHVLRVVAVLGDRVAAATIGRVAGLADTALAEALDDCEWQRWLLSDAQGYSYVARIVRQVIDRDMVTPGERRRILAAAKAQA